MCGYFRLNFPLAAQQVSSKLDFTESKEQKELQKSPKIQGVRVTVDTSKLQGSAG